MRTKLIPIINKVKVGGLWTEMREHTMAQRERMAELLDEIQTDGTEGTLTELTEAQQDGVLDVLCLILPDAYRGWIRDHFTMSDFWRLVRLQIQLNHQEELVKKAQAPR